MKVTSLVSHHKIQQDYGELVNKVDVELPGVGKVGSAKGYGQLMVEDVFTTSSTQPTKANRFLLPWFKGWRGGALTAALLAFSSLLVNIIAAAWLARHAQHKSDDDAGLLHRDQCSKIERTSVAVHLVINILSTLLLGGSNYCMQCLVAPSRQKIDMMHQQGRHLDIGIYSVRNLWRSSTVSKLLCFALVLTSLPLHFVYNSAFYTSISAHRYDVGIFSHDFVDNTNPNDLARGEQWASDSRNWKRLNNKECISAYATDFVTDYGDVVVVTSTPKHNFTDRYFSNVTDNGSNNQSSSSMLACTDYTNDRTDLLGLPSYDPYAWICSNISDGPDRRPCYQLVSGVLANSTMWSPVGYTADYCLARPVDQMCGLYANIPIVIIVIVCNAIKCAIMLYVALGVRHEPLIVIGDAIESFLQQPDCTTKNLGLVSSKGVVWRLESAHMDHCDNYRIESWEPNIHRRRKFAGASSLRWVLLSVLILATIGGALWALLQFGQLDTANDSFINYIVQLGFGSINGKTLMTVWSIGDGAKWTIEAVLLANIPQLVLSILYFNLNGLITSICLATEWARFSTSRRTLRVSTPKGNQRSTRFLTIPYRHAIPMMLLSILLHWLVSQCMFLAVVSLYDSEGKLLDPRMITTVGYSPLAIMTTIIYAGAVLIAVLARGFPRLNGNIPLAGSCSLAISAACHPPEHEQDISLKPVKWGVIPGVKDEDGIGHCSFSSEEVEPLQIGERYTNYIECAPCRASRPKSDKPSTFTNSSHTKPIVIYY